MAPPSPPGRHSQQKPPTASEPLPVAALGSVALDTLETPAARGERLLGGSATYFAAAARLATSVQVVSVVGEDFRPEDEAALRRLGLDLSMLERRPGATYAWHGRYGADFANATTVAREVGVIDGYAPPAAAGAHGGCLFLGAIDPAVQRQALDAAPAMALTALDSREAWIEEYRAEVLALAARVDFVFLNSFELALLTGRDSPAAGAGELLERGAGHVVVKRGADGAALHSPDGVLAVPAYPTTVVDPTGAGDAFAGGFIGAIAGGGSHGEALRHGAALASFTLESLGIEALAQLTREQLDQRAEAIEWSRED